MGGQVKVAEREAPIVSRNDLVCGEEGGKFGIEFLWVFNSKTVSRFDLGEVSVLSRVSSNLIALYLKIQY